MDFEPKAKNYLHSGQFKGLLRKWQGTNFSITSDNLMYPVFLLEDDDAIQPIDSMPGISRFGINKLKEHLEPLIQNGLSSILLFGVIEKLPKDEKAYSADLGENPVIKHMPKLKQWFPNLIIACDVCLCPYTIHGHCGILKNDGTIDNKLSIMRISQVALSYALAGCDIVAPSDMMDGRVGTIKNTLIDNNLSGKCAVLSYSVKFASSFYGPFRNAAKSAPAFGDRKAYQLPPNSVGLALRAAKRDIEEGADMIMVKPALAYLDIVQRTKETFNNYPLFVYQVSGEYSMLYHAAKAGAIDLKLSLEEILTSMRRAGADVIISYFTPEILNWLK